MCRMWMMPKLALVVALVAAVTAGCPPDEPPTTDADASADSDTLPNGRTYLLGGRAESYQIQGLRRWTITGDKLYRPMPEADEDATGADADATSDVDAGPEEPQLLVEAVVIPLHRLGIPWNDFAGDTFPPPSLPGAWVSAVNAAKQVADDLGRPVALALSPTSDTWDHLAPLAGDDGSGTLTLQENWLKDYCYDPSKDGNPTKWRDAYARYVRWAVSRFDPRFVFLAHRINRVDEKCSQAQPGTYAALAGFATHAHDALVAELGDDRPTTVVTVDVEDLYGYVEDGKKPGRCVSDTPAQCFDKRKALLDAFTADRMGLESYPAKALPFVGDGSVPQDWLGRVAAYRADMPPVIAGTGVPARSMETQQSICVPLLESSESLQRDWLDQVVGVAEAYQMELAVWRYPVDQLDADMMAPCQCSGDFLTCEHLNQLGANRDAVRRTVIEGLYTVDGTERQAGTVWQDLLQ